MRNIDYAMYKESDLDILTPRQKQVMQMKLAGIKVNDIADELKISQPVVSTLLHNARERLDGCEIHTQIYYRENKERFKQYREAHQIEIRESKRRYHEEHREERLEKMKEYNRAYYRENRERILKLAKDRRKEK